MLVRFRLLNKLKKLARNSNFAPSPSTFMRGRPKDFLIVASISKYRGSVKALRPMPGAVGTGPNGAPAITCANVGPVTTVGCVKYAAAPLGKSPPVLMNAL